MDSSIVSLKQNSIEVNKTSKGDFSFSIKVYYDEDRRNPSNVIDEIRTLMTELERRFK